MALTPRGCGNPHGGQREASDSWEPTQQSILGTLPSDTGSETEGGSWLQEGVAREFAMLWLLLSSLGLYCLSKEATCV